jgi:hypothetical protein
LSAWKFLTSGKQPISSTPRKSGKFHFLSIGSKSVSTEKECALSASSNAWISGWQNERAEEEKCLRVQVGAFRTIAGDQELPAPDCSGLALFERV